MDENEDALLFDDLEWMKTRMLCRLSNWFGKNDDAVSFEKLGFYLMGLPWVGLQNIWMVWFGLPVRAISRDYSVLHKAVRAGIRVLSF